MDDKKFSIVFTGDVAFDKYMDGRWEDEKLLSGEIYDFLHSADHVVINLEGALYQPSDLVKTDYFHAMNPEAVCALRRMKADIWSIGNNHSMDAGKEGLVSTKTIAKANRCKTFGAGRSEAEASQPVFLGEQAGGIGMICVGYQKECAAATAHTAGCLAWDNDKLIAGRIKEIKKTCRWCIVIAHGGEEFSPLPLPYTRERYIGYLKMGADVVVGHHPHVPENYETFEDGKMIFYSLGNFIFDTDYQRAHFYTDIGVLLKLNFTKDHLTFEAMGIKILRDNGSISTCAVPDIFTDILANEYQLLAPLAAKAFLAEDKRKMIYLNPSKYGGKPEALKDYFSGCSHEDYVKGSHMDFDIIVPLAQAAINNEWQNSKLSKVKQHILTLLRGEI